MTLARTIHRRNARKRAKARPRVKSSNFITPKWLIKESLREWQESVAMLSRIVKHYK